MFQSALRAGGTRLHPVVEALSTHTRILAKKHGLCVQPCFSPHKNAGETLDSHSDLRCRRWHPAKLRGRSVSPAFPCISFHTCVAGSGGALQRGKFPEQRSLRKRISQQLFRELHAQKSDNAQPAWVISRNPSTIASASEHRQPVFLHPRNGATSLEGFLHNSRTGN